MSKCISRLKGQILLAGDNRLQVAGGQYGGLRHKTRHVQKKCYGNDEPDKFHESFADFKGIRRSILIA